MNERSYRIRLQPEPEGGFTVTVPALPGCVSWGETYEHAVEMARDAIAGYLDVLEAEGLPVPVESITGPVEAIVTIAPSQAA
ncbi:MAG: type II toxin-antitoxin system HicB family antitoxin [Candidatus Hydrogenedens sp.]|nr:type II toxin-antitoxin system HicB family antitoxin [Candidatus Hydrogenedens sp.]